MIQYFKLYLNDICSNVSLTFIWNHVEATPEYLSELSKDSSGTNSIRGFSMSEDACSEQQLKCQEAY